MNFFSDFNAVLIIFFWIGIFTSLILILIISFLKTERKIDEEEKLNEDEEQDINY